MSGIATITKKLATKIQKANLKTRIAATRKTALGFMYFDKKAVIIGGGDPHRLHLDDMVLIKDNHLIFFQAFQIFQSFFNHFNMIFKIFVGNINYM